MQQRKLCRNNNCDVKDPAMQGNNESAILPSGLTVKLLKIFTNTCSNWLQTLSGLQIDKLMMKYHFVICKKLSQIH